VDDTISTEDVRGYDLAVEVDGQAPEAQGEAEALGLSTKGLLVVSRGDGVGDEDTAGRVEVRREVVRQNVVC